MKKGVYTIALLIDGDNASYRKIDGILNQLKNFGILKVKNVYADWSMPEVQSWKRVVKDYGLHKVQQDRYNDFKNSTDAAMIIDAMDFLHSGTFTAICIVSSDSDFTRLAQRIQLANIFVIGMGFRKSSGSFTKVCDEFIYLEDLTENATLEISIKASRNQTEHVSEKTQPTNKEKHTALEDAVPLPKELINFLVKYTNEHSEADGWLMAGRLSTATKRQFQNFDPKNYGFKQFSFLIKSLDKFEFKLHKDTLSLRVKK